MANDTPAAKQLRSFVDRISRLEDEKAQIADDIKSVYAEAKAAGFDKVVLRRVVKRARETESERAARREVEELTEVYLASLGMLDGTPLGDAARKRFEEIERRKRERRPDGKKQDGQPPAPAPEENAAELQDQSPPPESEKQPEETVEQARERGREDHRAGKRIVDNPYPANDPKRAAWDEGWCEEDGSDGMALPDAWRRQPKPDSHDKRPGA